MQDGPDINNIGFTASLAQRHHGFGEPVMQLVALLRVTHHLVVLDVVEDDQVRAVRAVAQTTQLFTTTGNGHLDIVGRDDGPHTPDATLPAHFREIVF